MTVRHVEYRGLFTHYCTVNLLMRYHITSFLLYQFLIFYWFSIVQYSKKTVKEESARLF